MSMFDRIRGLVGVGAGITVILAIPQLRQPVLDTIRERVPSVSWRTIAIVLALANIKNLPFVWHIRVFRAMLYHIYLQPTPVKPEFLFQPLIYATRTPLTEIDYNLHKSNSTYFTDLDEARAALVAAIFRKGIREATSYPKEGIEKYKQQLGKPELTEVPPGIFTIALGGVTCHFRKEVDPYEKVEVWTRVLCWDRKWVYTVSYIIRAGVVKPPSYSLQPGKRGRKMDETAEERQKRLEKAKNAVIAVSIAKYVVKKGRLTIPPELSLINSGMLPPKPEDSPPAYKLPTYTATYNEASTLSSTPESVSDSTGNVLAESLFPAETDGESWTWDRVEAQRMRGLEFAEHFAALDGILDTFDGGDSPAMGRYQDIFSM